MSGDLHAPAAVPHEKSPRCPMLLLFGSTKGNVLTVPEIKPPFLGHPARKLVPVLTELSRLLYIAGFCCNVLSRLCLSVPSQFRNAYEFQLIQPSLLHTLAS